MGSRNSALLVRYTDVKLVQSLVPRILRLVNNRKRLYQLFSTFLGREVPVPTSCDRVTERDHVVMSQGGS